MLPGDRIVHLHTKVIKVAIGDPGLQPERTILAWGRTILLLGANILLLWRVAVASKVYIFLIIFITILFFLILVSLYFFRRQQLIFNELYKVVGLKDAFAKIVFLVVLGLSVSTLIVVAVN